MGFLQLSTNNRAIRVLKLTERQYSPVKNLARWAMGGFFSTSLCPTHSTWNAFVPVEFCGMCQEYTGMALESGGIQWNGTGIHRNGPEFQWNPQEWTGIPAESARVDWNLRNLQEWTRICRNVVWNLHYFSSLSLFWKELYNLYIYTQAFSIFSHLFNLI